MRDVSTLLEALPYIREFHGRTVVIKYGGAAMEDPALREDFARDVVLLKYVGMNPVVVHGGGPDITAYMERLGIPVEFVGGLRVSSAETVEIAKMVLIGKVNKDIVSRLNRHGQSAIGLSGDDGRLFLCERTTAAGGEEGIERAQNEEFSVAVVDILMPGLDGLETLKRLRHESPGTEVVLLTGHGGFWRTDQRLPAASAAAAPAPAAWPEVAAVVPARDEAAILPVTLPAHDQVSSSGKN